MNFVDLHIHTTFSDGINTPEEIVNKAIDSGMKKIGISDHSYTFFDESYCIKKDSICEYINEIKRLKEKYRDKIEVLLGIEKDFYSDTEYTEYDYVIGSVHYLKVNDEYIPVDENTQMLLDACNKYFNGDIYSLIEKYYETISKFAENKSIDIIGHFDIITKFNNDNSLFDETNPRYISAFKNAAKTLIQCSKTFEINTGAISRGYKNNAYPSDNILKFLKSKGAKFILSSDSHSCETLCYDFSKYKQYI